MARHRRARGFTLIEMVMVIVIVGVIGSMVAVFIKRPVDAYFDALRRAALADAADGAVRRMARDIRSALPNSLRQSSNQCVEFIPTKTGGRYRAEESVAGDNTSLDFSSADSSFNMFGRNDDLPAYQQITPGDLIAVYNLGITGADAYAGDNTAVVSSVVNGTETVIGIASKLFPLASGSNRFHVVPGGEKIVSFVCSAGVLYRNANYAYSSSCPTTGGSVLAAGVDTCDFLLNGSDLQRNALVQMKLRLSKDGETVSLYHETHVDNTP